MITTLSPVIGALLCIYDLTEEKACLLHAGILHCLKGGCRASPALESCIHINLPGDYA